MLSSESNGKIHQEVLALSPSTFAIGPLPLIVEPKDLHASSTASLIEWVEGNSKWLDGKLLIHGGILLRGFAVYESAEFQQVAQSLIPELKPYVEGQSPWTKVLDKVYTSPGVFQHPETNETHWFNQANLWHVSNFEARRREQLLRLCGEENLPTHAYYGDGTPISDEELYEVRRVMWDNAIAFRWERGDVLLLDNYLVAHGRNPYEGPRKILVAMG